MPIGHPLWPLHPAPVPDRRHVLVDPEHHQMNYAAMRANRMPTSMPAKLAIAANAQAIGLSTIRPSAETSPDDSQIAELCLRRVYDTARPRIEIMAAARDAAAAIIA